jgi:hypothetical protein
MDSRSSNNLCCQGYDSRFKECQRNRDTVIAVQGSCRGKAAAAKQTAVAKQTAEAKRTAIKQEHYVQFPIGDDDEDEDDEEASGDDDDDDDDDDNDRRDEKQTAPNRYVDVVQDLEDLAAHAQVLKSRVVGLKIADLDDKLRRLCELLTSLNFSESQQSHIIAQARQNNNIV